MKTKRGKAIIAVVVLAEVVSAVFTWRDLRGRPDSEVRGSKKLWRVLSTVNPGNSIAYWAFGRRRGGGAA